MFKYLVQTVNNMYQNVSDKAIENQEMILRILFILLRTVGHVASRCLKNARLHPMEGDQSSPK